MTRTRIAALASSLALSLALTAPSTAALAFSLSYERPQRHAVQAAPHGQAPAAGPGLHGAPAYGRCAASSAAEGNASQQARPVKQYGQTAGGYRC